LLLKVRINPPKKSVIKLRQKTAGQAAGEIYFTGLKSIWHFVFIPLLNKKQKNSYITASKN
jgi:hypothetical protein